MTFQRLAYLSITFFRENDFLVSFYRNRVAIVLFYGTPSKVFQSVIEFVTIYVVDTRLVVGVGDKC